MLLEGLGARFYCCRDSRAGPPPIPASPRTPEEESSEAAAAAHAAQTGELDHTSSYYAQRCINLFTCIHKDKDKETEKDKDKDTRCTDR